MREIATSESNARGWMENHIKSLVDGIDYDHFSQMKTSESEGEITIGIEFSDPKGLGGFLGG